MNPFSKKKRNQSLYDILTPEEIEELKESTANEKPISPYVLTKDEIEHEDENKTFFPDISPFEELKKRIMGEETEEFTDEVVFTNFSVNTEIFEEAEEETAQEEPKEDVAVQLSAFDDITGPYPEVNEEEEKEEDNELTLFQMCIPFLTDNDGELPKEEPLYVLDSVEKILGIEENDNVTIKEIPLGEEETVVTKMEDLAKTQVISDIEIISSQEVTEPKSEDTQSFTKTMPVIVTPEGLQNSCEIDISPEMLKKDSLKSDFSGISEKDPDDDFIPSFEYSGINETKKTRKLLHKIRKNRFLMMLLSIFAFLFVGITTIVTQNSAGKNIAALVIGFIGAAASVFSAYDCAKALPSLFTKRTESDTLFFFTQLFTLTGMVFAAFSGLDSIVILGLSLSLCTSTLTRNIFLFKKASYIYQNFRIVSARGEKYTVSLIDDKPTTFAMAHRAIDGDVLVAAARETSFPQNFMRNSTVDRDLNSLVRIVLLAGIAITALFSVVVGFYHSDFSSSVISFSALSSLLCPFILFGTNTLPLSSANAKLNKLGGAVLGIKSALKLEECNALALDSCNIFPKGSINLYSLKILNENNLEETIAIAAAITETIKSPLYPIFKAATETNSEINIPVADSIKYEERLGITGWVGDSRVFIGNRALMLAHEIPVGDAAEDKRLLSEGYFPVYLARDGKACALLAVSYEPQKNIAKQLQRITEMGITLLINNCDQNICEEMLCDYFELYADSVKIMSGSGVHMYKNAVTKTENDNANGVMTGRPDALAGIIGCSVKIKKSHTLLVAACLISIAVGFVYFAYSHFLLSSLFVSAFDILLFKLATLAVTLIAYLFTKP